MIPDKIYIPRYPDYKLGERLGDEWMYEPHKEVNNAEYIRKDALLEWLKGQMTEEETEEGVILGYNIALKELINHIKSL